MNNPQTPSRVDEPGHRPQDPSSGSRADGSAPGLATTGATRRRRDIPIPLPGGDRVFWIAASFPVTAEEWAYVMNVLTVMRPGLANGAATAGVALALYEMPWRVGRKLGRTIYAQIGQEPSDNDPLIGVMDSVVLAEEAVLAHNVGLDMDASTLADHLPDNDESRGHGSVR